MCLGAPGRVVQVSGGTALVDFGGVTREVALDLVDEPVSVGDHVLVHVGFALRRIDEADRQLTLSLLSRLADGGDPSEVLASIAPSSAEHTAPGEGRSAGVGSRGEAS